jgi:ABC-type Mn2+/Zn2+ transport system ATPase subunit
VARGLIREPILVVLDEPMNHLDPEAEQTLLHDLLELNRSGDLALVLVTHDVAMAEQHATHLAIFAGQSVATRRTERALDA